jgi:hypothetical protein
MLRLVLLIAAAVCFLLAAFGVPIPRINLVALGLFFLTMGEFLIK